jgi:hypothetical protein
VNGYGHGWCVSARYCTRKSGVASSLTRSDARAHQTRDPSNFLSLSGCRSANALSSTSGINNDDEEGFQELPSRDSRSDGGKRGRDEVLWWRACVGLSLSLAHRTEIMGRETAFCAFRGSRPGYIAWMHTGMANDCDDPAYVHLGLVVSNSPPRDRLRG